MKKSITVIQGTSDLGKTETLNVLIDLLSCVVYDYEIKKYNEWTNDRRAVFNVGGNKICVCTAGDNEEEANRNIDFIKKNKATIVFTACHNTNAISRSVVKEFSEQSGYDFIIEKKEDNSQESRRLATKFFIQIMQQAEEQTD
jgi:hypothetical protein